VTLCVDVYDREFDCLGEIHRHPFVPGHTEGFFAECVPGCASSRRLDLGLVMLERQVRLLTETGHGAKKPCRAKMPAMT